MLMKFVDRLSPFQRGLATAGISAAAALGSVGLGVKMYFDYENAEPVTGSGCQQYMYVDATPAAAVCIEPGLGSSHGQAESDAIREMTIEVTLLAAAAVAGSYAVDEFKTARALKGMEPEDFVD